MSATLKDITNIRGNVPSFGANAPTFDAILADIHQSIREHNHDFATAAQGTKIATSGLSGDVVLKSFPFINVTHPDYGASTTASDNSTALQAALDAVAAAGGGIVWIPSGTYSYATGLELTTPQNVIIAGEGTGSILSYTGTGTALTLGNDVNIRYAHNQVLDLKITTSTGTTAIHSKHCTQCNYERLFIQGFSDYAIIHDGGFFSVYRDNRIYLCKSGYKIQKNSGGSRANVTQILGGEIQSANIADATGIYIDDCHGCIIDRIAIEGNTDYGIILNDTNGSFIDRCWIEMTGGVRDVTIQGTSKSNRLWRSLRNVYYDLEDNSEQPDTNFQVAKFATTLHNTLHGVGHADTDFDNLASDPSFVSAHNITSAGSTGVTPSQTTILGHSDKYSASVEFPSGGSGLDFAAARFDNTQTTIAADEVYTISFSARVTGANQTIWAYWGDGTNYDEVNSFAGLNGQWQRFQFQTKKSTGSGTYYLYVTLNSDPGAARTIRFDDVSVVKTSTSTPNENYYFPYVKAKGFIDNANILYGQFGAVLGDTVVKRLDVREPIWEDDFQEAANTALASLVLSKAKWTSGGTNGGGGQAFRTAATQDTGGLFELVTGGNDNDSSWILSTAVFNSDDGCVLKCRLKVDDRATVYVAAGFTDASFNDKGTLPSDYVAFVYDTDEGDNNIRIKSDRTGGSAISLDTGVELTSDTFVEVQLDMTSRSGMKAWIDDAEVTSTLFHQLDADTVIYGFIHVQQLAGSITRTGTVDYFKVHAASR